MGFINLGRLNSQKRNSCASALVSLSDVQPPSVYKSHILNGSINKLYLNDVMHTSTDMMLSPGIDANKLSFGPCVAAGTILSG